MHHLAVYVASSDITVTKLFEENGVQHPGRCVEIKCQLDATDVFYCRSNCLLNMFRVPLCPSSGAREYYTVGCRLLMMGIMVPETC
jgi:hypothetical protein